MRSSMRFANTACGISKCPPRQSACGERSARRGGELSAHCPEIATAHSSDGGNSKAPYLDFLLGSLANQAKNRDLLNATSARACAKYDAFPIRHASPASRSPAPGGATKTFRG